MKGKVNVVNLTLVPEGLNKEDFHFEHTFTTREDKKSNDIKTCEASVIDTVLSNVEQNTSSSFIATQSAATNVLKAEDRNTIQVGSKWCTDEEERALINNRTCSTLIRTIDDHSDEESTLNPTDVTNSIFLAREDSMLP